MPLPNIKAYKKRRNNSKRVHAVTIEHEMKVEKRSRVLQIMEEFCTNSSIHGLRYFVDREHLHWVERIWWIAAFVLSISCCVTSIYIMWLKWSENPVIISFDHRPLHISAIPFPATTICPVIKSRADIFNYTHVYRLISRLEDNDKRAPNKTELKFMQVATQTCDEWFGSEMRKNYDDNFTDNSILSTIAQMAAYDDTLVLCKLFNRLSDCSEIVFPIYTTEGLCFTFNSMNINDVLTDETATEFKRIPSVRKASKWNSDLGYIDQDDINAYPYRAYGMGRRESFRAILKFPNQDTDYLCGGAFSGLKVTFHLPNELPQIRRKFYHVGINQAAMFLVAPNVIATSPTLRNYAPAVRQCYFSSERKLRFFRHYTQQNCELECLSNFSIAECGCVNFARPRSQEMKVCGTQKILCISRAEKTLLSSGAADRCNCLPSCNTLTYDIEPNLVQYDFLDAWSKSRFPMPFGFANSSFPRVTVTFKIENLLPSKRIEFYNYKDFLANSGGLFGLFMGASLLSFVELIYYLMIRPFYMVQGSTQR